MELAHAEWLRIEKKFLSSTKQSYHITNVETYCLTRTWDPCFLENLGSTYEFGSVLITQ